MACNWKDSSKQMQEYHNQEWGIPTHDDQKLFEYLVLESLQAGLSWELIIRKREVIRKCFCDFDVEKSRLLILMTLSISCIQTI